MQVWKINLCWQQNLSIIRNDNTLVKSAAKYLMHAPEPYNLLEAEFEKVIRREIRRGTVQVHLRLDKQAAAQDFRINAVALESYLRQLRTLGTGLGVSA